MKQAVQILVDHGWLTMNESDAIWVLVSHGVRPSRLSVDLSDIIHRAKLQMLADIKLAS